VIAEAAEGGHRETYESVGKNGTMQRVKPIFAALAEAERRLRDWLGRFGLTPADRSRVSTGDNGKGKKRKEDEFAS
jgi:phage terminase small subunit